MENLSLSPDGLAFEKHMTKKKDKVGIYNFGFLAVWFFYEQMF